MAASAAHERRPRDRARGAFWALYAGGFALGLVLRAVDAPHAVGIPLVVLWGVAVVASGGAWLTLAVRDGTLARAVPDYLFAALGLVVIALGCAATALVALLAVGADVTVERVTGWAAIGTFAVLVVYWLARAARARDDR